jgi:Family of unknown function (DUF6084)
VTQFSFAIDNARPERHAAVPTLVFDLRVAESSGAEIQSVALRCQVRIEPQRRRYSAEEQARLLELFGEAPRWADTLKPFLWTHASVMIPRFSGGTEVELHVPCTYDFDVTAAKYFQGLEHGEIPLLMLFSGTAFVQGKQGLEISQVPWSNEAPYRLPIPVWRELVDLYFPNSGWLRLRRDTLSELLKFKARRGLVTWDEVVECLLTESQRPHL